MHTETHQIADAIYQHGFQIIDNLLADHHYRALYKTLETMHSNGQLHDAKIGNKHRATANANIRRDQISWLDEASEDPAIAAYFEEINNLRCILNRSLFLGLVDSEAHFAVYTPGSFYKKHVDQFLITPTRRISCVYYLNTEWRPELGGELKLYDQEDQLLHSVAPLANRLVCFSSELPHEVCTTYQTRYSIACWLKTRAINR